MRISWVVTAAIVLTVGCKKKSPPDRETVTPSTATASPTIPAPPPPAPPPMPSQPATSLRVRAVVAKADDMKAFAMCRPDEQLIGGSCSGYYKPQGYAVRADRSDLATGDHTFGAGWSCPGDPHALAQALCLSDSAGPLPAVEK